MSEFELSGLLSMDASSMVGGLEDATEASGELADETEELSDGVDETTDPTSPTDNRSVRRRGQTFQIEILIRDSSPTGRYR